MPSIEKAWNLFFNDPDKWVKLLIGAVVMLVPVVNLAGNGYGMEVMRRHIKGQPARLPRWDDFGRFWVDGLKVALILLGYFILPFILYMLLSVLAFGEDSIFLILLLGLTFIPVGIFLAVLLPPAIACFVDTGRLGAAFEFGTVWKTLTSRLSQWIIADLLLFGLAVAASILASIFITLLPFIGGLLYFPALFVVMVMGSHMFAQVYTGREENPAYGGYPSGGFTGQIPAQPPVPPYTPPVQTPPPYTPPYTPPVQTPPPYTPAFTPPGETQSQEPAVPQVAATAEKYCPACGAANPTDAGFCSSCGKSLQ